MGSLKIVIEDELLKKFRKEAMKRFGYTKGALSIAGREAIKNWLAMDSEDKKRKYREFIKAMEKAAGCWAGKDGYSYVRKIRKESEKRLKRLGL